MNLRVCVIVLLLHLVMGLDNCLTHQGQTIEWSIVSNSIEMRVNCSKGGSVGYCAIGFNSNGVSMPGASIIMGYGTNKMSEYRATGNSMPIKSVIRITNAVTRPTGTKRSLSFRRPLAVETDSSFFPISNSVINFMIVYNDVATPKSDTRWNQHTITYQIPINFFVSKPCTWKCNGRESTDRLVCSGHGTCVSADTCNCLSGYLGQNCETHQCFGVQATSAQVCSGNGACSAPNTCNCRLGFSGQRCELISCFGILSNNPTVCSGNGTCTTPNGCLCNVFTTGSQCQTQVNRCENCNTTCFGIPRQDPFACNAKGVCIGQNNCTCLPGYYGDSCNRFSCFGIDSMQKSCSSNGICMQPDQCSCFYGFIGTDCSVFTCFSIPSNQAGVCSTHGKCLGVDICQCDKGFTGPTCELEIDPKDPPIVQPLPLPQVPQSINYENCISLSDARVEWNVVDQMLQMRVNFSNGAKGWNAIGFNRPDIDPTDTMRDANMIITYNGLANEYIGTGHTLPSIIPTRISKVKAEITNGTTSLQFERPMFDPSALEYISLLQGKMTLLIAYNERDMPGTPNNIPMHTNAYSTQINLLVSRKKTYYTHQ